MRQFRTVRVVGSERFVSASISFERACPFGTLTYSSRPEIVSSSGQVGREVAEREIAEVDGVGEERDDDPGRVVDGVRVRLDDARELGARADDDRDVVPGRLADRGAQRARPRSFARRFGVNTTLPLWR